jgi:hypothetical protein
LLKKEKKEKKKMNGVRSPPCQLLEEKGCGGLVDYHQ